MLNCYAQAASRCQEWNEAAKIFATIGDDFDSRAWSRKDFDAAREMARAATRAKDGNK